MGWRPLNKGERIDRYRIVKRLGGGGMGDVYLAHDGSLDRKAAIKVPRLSAYDDEKVIARFLAEAKAAARFIHPNLCQVYEVGLTDGMHWFAMRYIEGPDLAQALRDAEANDKPFAAEASVALVATVAGAVEYAHAGGLLHRDLKPGNVMFDPRTGEPVVMDFGLARTDAPQGGRLTQSGAAMGTPAYMPLEQADGDLASIGPPSDVYSLGAVLYEMLTGRTPVEGNYAQMLAQLVTATPAAPSSVRPISDRRLDAICLKALSRRPQDRFLTMIEFESALRTWLLQRADRGGIVVAARPRSGVNDFPVVKPRPRVVRGELIATIESSRMLRSSFGLPPKVANAVRSLSRSRAATLGGTMLCFATIAVLVWFLFGRSEADPIDDDPLQAVDAVATASAPGAPPAATASAGSAAAAAPFPSPSTEAEPQERVSVSLVADGARSGEKRVFSSEPAITFSWCEPGSFLMGSRADDPEAHAIEKPQVSVTLSKGFWLARSEVTQEQWRRVMGTEPWLGKTLRVNVAGPEYPACWVSWKDAAAFCATLTSSERAAGRLPAEWEYSLPTEAQWEFACRAGTTTRFEFGDDAASIGEYAWVLESASEDPDRLKTAKLPNRWGLLHMPGGVWEWCEDSYAGRPLPGGIDPLVTDEGDGRIRRGGSFLGGPREARSAHRNGTTLRFAYEDVGFRVACVRTTPAAETQSGVATSSTPSAVESQPSRPAVALQTIRGWQPSWHPDGKRLIYKDFELGLATIELKTLAKTTLNAQGADPALSPKDGDRFAYHEGNGVFLKIADGDPVRIGDGASAKWALTGDRIFFYDRSKRAIRAVDVDAASLPANDLLNGIFSLYSAASPSGELVATQEGQRIAVIAVKTRNVVATCPAPGWNGALFGWSPDSRYVAFGSYANGDARGLWVLNAETGAWNKVIDGNLTHPNWAYDGSLIACDNRTDRQIHIYRVSDLDLP